jgi:solute:Na+ symporter, SSS family
MYTFLDLSVFVGYFVIVVAIGFVCGRRQQASVDGYFRGHNQLPWYTVGLSIVAAGIRPEQFVG